MQLLRRQPEGKLTPLAAARFCAMIVLGLSALHEAGLAYRDLKPENLLLRVHCAPRRQRRQRQRSRATHLLPPGRPRLRRRMDTCALLTSVSPRRFPSAAPRRWARCFTRRPSLCGTKRTASVPPPTWRGRASPRRQPRPWPCLVVPRSWTGPSVPARHRRPLRPPGALLYPPATG